MFIIIGTQTKKEDIGCLPEPRICPRCQRLVYHQIIREQRWFTAFWIPLFPVQSSQYFQCPCCGLTFHADNLQSALTDQKAGSHTSSALEKGARQAGRLYSRLKKYLDETD